MHEFQIDSFGVDVAFHAPAASDVNFVFLMFLFMENYVDQYV